jgi:hypothetical protein
MPSRTRLDRMHWFRGDCAEHTARRTRLLTLHPEEIQISFTRQVGFKAACPLVPPQHEFPGGQGALSSHWVETWMAESSRQSSFTISFVLRQTHSRPHDES